MVDSPTKMKSVKVLKEEDVPSPEWPESYVTGVPSTPTLKVKTDPE